ncbi:NAD(P)/FAD-dependent oxidoreductase [Pseudorhodoferax sp.]|uniref:NAD(P)/FAD-dependent oxidoreductase n=1 Tax=Pseudorhodoferax sp. TaxID=1993553 RepID=UPI002DD63FB5|nr:FAD-binding oxidoreductase [Pseudorhodoferax sp.]
MSFLSVDQDLARDSYYAATAVRELRFASLQGDQQADVAIVGGGLAGLSAAIELADRGRSVVLLEARQVAWGASGRNGGQALAGLACDQSEIERQLGEGPARDVWQMTLEALDLITQRCQRFGIDCDWQSGYLSLAVNERKAGELRRWHENMQRSYGYEATWISPKEMRRWIDSPRFHSGIHDARSGHLHPLKYSLGLARAAAQLGVQIFEDSPVVRLETGARPRLYTANGSVTADQVLLAGNVYLQGVARQVEPRIMPVGTYIVCSEPLDPALCASLIPSRSAVCDTNFVLDYFRPTADHRMLYGGRVSYSTSTPPNLVASMRKRMATTFPQLADCRIDYSWGGFVDISLNRAPDFGRLPKNGAQSAPSDGLYSVKSHHSNVYYLQGFSGHGLALTGLAGKLVAEAMTGDAARFDVFARLKHRPFPGGAWLRTPALVLGMAYYRVRDAL